MEMLVLRTGLHDGSCSKVLGKHHKDAMGIAFNSELPGYDLAEVNHNPRSQLQRCVESLKAETGHVLLQFIAVSCNFDADVVRAVDVEVYVAPRRAGRTLSEPKIRTDVH